MIYVYKVFRSNQMTIDMHPSEVFCTITWAMSVELLLECGIYVVPTEATVISALLDIISHMQMKIQLIVVIATNISITLRFSDRKAI